MSHHKADASPKWVYPKTKEDWQSSIVSEFNIHPVTAQVLVSRGFESVDDIHSYLYAKLPNLLDPHLLLDMDKAISRIFTAYESGENILIYGDNDVDGMSGTSLLVEFFRHIGCRVFYYVPNRNSLKQNIITDALDFALKNTCSLLITVDCGITAAKEIEEASRHNVDVIITDHHEPTDRMPHCIATLNPKLLKSTYPNRDLTGVGVAFKLVHAFTNYLVERGKISQAEIDLKRYLDLVALGTIADMGALTGENRILVRYGLREFATTKRVGLLHLLKVCGVDRSSVTTADIASKVAPRLNSLGRIDDPRKGVQLLLIKNDREAEALANELDLNNTERQRIERRDSDDIEKYLASHPEVFKERAIVLHSTKWHPGIIPIISARIAKQYNRPTLIISVDDGVGKGSFRTIPEFPLLGTLKRHSGLLINFGGHDYAAGLTIRASDIDAFKKHFIAEANAALKPHDVIPKLYLDSRCSFKDLTFDFLDSLSLLEPHGTENPPPIFYTEVKQAWPPKIVGKTHLKLYLEQDDRMLEGIAFGFAHKRPLLLKKNLPLKIAFTPHINVFLNKSSIQLLIRDFKTG